jgi:outer membrane protein
MKRKTINTNLLLLMILFSSIKTTAQQRNEFTVKQTVDYGLKNSVAVKNALIDIQIQKQTNREITANALPQLNASSTGTHFFNIAVQSLPNFIAPSTYQVLVQEGVKDAAGNPIQFPAGGFGNIAAQFGVPWTLNGGLEFSQLLFDGQVFVGLQARSAAMDLATKTAEVTSEQIKANIYKIYYQIAVGKKQATSIDANIERFEKLLFDVRQIYKQGFAEKLDVEKIEVQLNNIRVEKIKIDNQLEAGYAGLKFLINMPQKDVLVLTDTVSEASLKENILDTAYDYNNRKEIQLLNIASKLGEYNVKRYKLGKLPTVAAFGSYQKNAQRNQFDFFGKGPWFTTSLVGVKISAPLFDGFARKARIVKAKLDLEKTKNNIAQFKELIDFDVNSANIKMKNALLTIDNQKQNVTLAEKVYNTTKKKFEAGLGTNQEIYNAQTDLKVAQTNYYSALYDAVIAKIDYLKAVGRL